MQLQSGQNSALGTGPLRATLKWSPSGALVLDASAFVLATSGKVANDAGFVFYGQPAHPSGALRLDSTQSGAIAFTIDPARLPGGTERVILALSVDQAASGNRPFSTLTQVTLELSGPGTDLSFNLSTASMEETALIMGELYLRQGTWKFRALGQGFRGGLGPLAINYGVDVTDATPAPAPTPAPVPPAAPPPSSSAAAKTINLSKRTPVSLDKPTAGYGKITVNLNWSRGEQKRGLFGFGGGGGIDLDLGCMLSLRNGHKDVVQALGNTFGHFDHPPYAHLLGDDRSGDSASGETLLINGSHWAEFERVLIYAFIYEGVPDWASADGVVRISAPGTPELIVRLDEPGGGKGMCAIAMLENDGGRIRVTKLIEYFNGHEAMDRAFGFGFTWQAGRK